MCVAVCNRLAYPTLQRVYISRVVMWNPSDRRKGDSVGKTVHIVCILYYINIITYSWLKSHICVHGIIIRATYIMYHVYVMCDYNELIQMSNMLHTYIVIGCGVGVCYNAIWPKCVRRIYIDTPSHHYVSHARDKLMEWGHESVMERSVGSVGLNMRMLHASALVGARLNK